MLDILRNFEVWTSVTLACMQKLFQSTKGAENSVILLFVTDIAVKILQTPTNWAVVSLASRWKEVLSMTLSTKRALVSTRNPCLFRALVLWWIFLFYGVLFSLSFLTKKGKKKDAEIQHQLLKG